MARGQGQGFALVVELGLQGQNTLAPACELGALQKAGEGRIEGQQRTIRIFENAGDLARCQAVVDGHGHGGAPVAGVDQFGLAPGVAAEDGKTPPRAHAELAQQAGGPGDAVPVLAPGEFRLGVDDGPLAAMETDGVLQGRGQRQHANSKSLAALSPRMARVSTSVSRASRTTRQGHMSPMGKG